MITRTIKTLILAAVAAALMGGLAACGKKAGLRPPEENAADYTYPNVYPPPESVLPQGSVEDEAADADEGAPAP